MNITVNDTIPHHIFQCFLLMHSVPRSHTFRDYKLVKIQTIGHHFDTAYIPAYQQTQKLFLFIAFIFFAFLVLLFVIVDLIQ